MTGEVDAMQQTEEAVKPPPPVILPKMLTDYDIVDRLDDKQMATVIYFILFFAFRVACV
jgi:hypothetical protein